MVVLICAAAGCVVFYLSRWRKWIGRRRHALADLEVCDSGKLTEEMPGQRKCPPHWFQYYGYLADKIECSVIPIARYVPLRHA